MGKLILLYLQDTDYSGFLRPVPELSAPAGDAHTMDTIKRLQCLKRVNSILQAHLTTQSVNFIVNLYVITNYYIAACNVICYLLESSWLF